MLSSPLLFPHSRPLKDKRLTARHEPLLASDIHMAQINSEKEWLFFIQEFILPVIAKVFYGYSTKVTHDALGLK